jgi:hypothetical protein
VSPDNETRPKVSGRAVRSEQLRLHPGRSIELEHVRRARVHAEVVVALGADEERRAVDGDAEPEEIFGRAVRSGDLRLDPIEAVTLQHEHGPGVERRRAARRSA